MIKVRDDDVLLPSRSHSDPEKRFREVHSLIISHNAHHVASILCNPIQKYPKTIQYILKEMEKGHITPELHGWDHIDYGILTRNELIDNLECCLEWFVSTFNRRPSIFYTPWGANDNTIRNTAQLYGMRVVDCSNIISPRTIQKSPVKYRGNKNIEIFTHWWAGMGRLKAALRILNGI